MVPFLRIGKYLRILSKRVDSFQYGAKERKNSLRTLVIKHYLNGDSQGEIVKKVLLSRPTVQSTIKKYKNTKCIENLFGGNHKWRTIATTDRLIQRKIKTSATKISSYCHIRIRKRSRNTYQRVNC